jgi:dTMP kinase
MIVLCDRFYDSTTAYQGYGRGLDIRMVRSLHKVAVGKIIPDLTIIVDVDINTAQKRIGKSKDRLESLPTKFHQKVRNGFLEIARKEKRRVKIVDGTLPIKTVFEAVKKLIDRKLTR